MLCHFKCQLKIVTFMFKEHMLYWCSFSLLLTLYLNYYDWLVPYHMVGLSLFTCRISTFIQIMLNKSVSVNTPGLIKT